MNQKFVLETKIYCLFILQIGQTLLAKLIAISEENVPT